MNNIKKIFFTSDWHIGHENILKYSNRPFKDLNHMHETLITRYNATVTSNSVCYFLGDVGNKTEDIKKVVSKLNGTKVLILGNHDKGMTTMYNCGFDVVLEKAELYIAKHRVTLSHCPLLDVWREDTTGMTSCEGEPWHGNSRELNRRLSWPDEDQFHLHGHIHSLPNNPKKSKRILNKQMDVGVDSNKYTPVSASQIESWIMTYEYNQ